MEVEADVAPRPASGRRARRGRPWQGRATRTDWFIAAGIALRSVHGFAVLPLIPLLLASHPLLLLAVSGSSVAGVVVGAQVRLGEISWPVAVLAGLPVWVLFDWFYWWAGRRWGDRALNLLLARTSGSPEAAARQAARLEQVIGRFGPFGVVLARFLPVPTVLVHAAAGTGGMRLWVFLLLDVAGSVLTGTVVLSLGYLLGQGAVDLVEEFNRYALVAAVAVVVLLVLAQLGRRRRRLRRPPEQPGA